MFKSSKVMMFFSIILFVVLTGCAPSAQHEYNKGRTAYMQQQYQLSSIHIKNAAKAGDPDAQYALGYMYYYGRGVQQDEGQAKYWISKAAAAGQPLAKKALAELHLSVPAPSHAKAKLKSATIHKQAPKPLLIIGKKKLPAAHHIIKRYHAPKAKHGYGIQLFGSYSKARAEYFINKYKLKNKARIHTTTHNNKKWYIVMHGNYASAKTAARALHKLPLHLKNMHPWVRKV